MTRHRPLPVPLEELPFVLRLADCRPPLDWFEIFGRRAPVEIEIGSGKGLFLAEAAQRSPEVDFLGVECAGKWFRRAAHRLFRASLPNVRIVQADAFDFLGRWVASGSVRVVHVYFPDPWPKKRHARRRLLQEELYRLAAKSLAPGGEFRFASDVQGYFDDALAALSNRPGFRRLSWTEDARDGLPTNYAVKYRREGRTLYAARFAVDPERAGGGSTAAPAAGRGACGEAAAPDLRVLRSPAGGAD